MSFITKRERVFHEYNLLDLPARNEGKLKAYASCTDARAWSHFCADKSDHLVEIIKRNNETCRPKYVPTDVIVNTLMGTKNAEITRLRRKIEEFEQLLAAYDQLELTCDQKIEITNAHAAIKAANKELDDMCLDLDLSGYTEGIDSEAFQTGKSRGDEVSRHKDFELETSRGTEWSFDKLSITNKESKGNQFGGLSCPCDASTGAVDPRIDEMQEMIIAKDAKMNAMRNTIAVMENDVCEPYCIYAHIYTALEKIYGILCQNEKYKCYLELLTSGKDTRNVDIKGKIFYKLKVFEKFCCALISPCSNDCSCYHAEIISRVETAFALSTDESVKINIDTQRAHLVADIMGNEEMKELLNKRNSCDKIADSAEDDFFANNNPTIDADNIYRLKDLQASYDDLLTCYDDLKFEKQCLTNKCRKYEELEKQFDTLRDQLNSYNSLWSEKEYYKKRSEDLDLLKEKYLVLADETLNLETQLKAQEEINNVKSVTLEQLRSENSILEKKLNGVSALCEKEKHGLVCKLKECECKMICQDEQIKSLSLQLNKVLENHYKDISAENELDSASLHDKIELQKEEIKNLKNALFFNDEEKQELQLGYEEKLKIINSLRLEIEEWKRICEHQTRRSNDLEKLTEETKEELKKIAEENKNLVQEVEIKNVAIENLMNVVSNKSLEINKLANEIELQTIQNKQLQEINELFNDKISTLENERKEAFISLDLARKESNTLLENIFKLDNFNNKQNINYDEYETDEPIEHNIIYDKEKRARQQQENESNINLVPMNQIDTSQVDNMKDMYLESNVNTNYLDMRPKDLNYEDTMNLNHVEMGVGNDEANASAKKIEVKQQLQQQRGTNLGPINENDTILINDIKKLRTMYSENNEKNNYLEMEDSDLNKEEIMKSKNLTMGRVTDNATTSVENHKTNQQLQSQSKRNQDLITEIDTFRLNNKKNIKKILSESSIKYSEIKGANNEIIEIKTLELDELKEKLLAAEESYKHLLLENSNLMKQLEEKVNRIDEANREIQELKEEKHRCLSQINDTERIKEYLSQLKRENKSMYEKKNNLENDVLLKNEEIKNLTDLVNKLKVGKQQFDVICHRLETLEKNTKNLSTAYEGLIIEKNNVLPEIKRQKDQLQTVLDNLEIKTNENNKLINDLKVSREQYISAQNKIDSLERNLNNMKAENNVLKEKLQSYSNLESELDAIKKSYLQLKAEKENLDHDLKSHLNLLEKMKIENEKLHDESNHLVEYNKDIENALIGARHEIQSQLDLPSNSLMNLKKEVEQLKKEKDSNLKQIKQMTDKLCESEELITNLTQDISERDVKISILENHINNLSNEVRTLQGSLGSVIDLGEEMNFKNQEIDQSLKQIEAHHSKATHNMKIDIAKLKNENVKLEEKLSATNYQFKMLSEKDDTPSSQEIRLQDERDKIVISIKKLETKCVGNSALSHNNSSINSILKSLENIGNHVEASSNTCQLVLHKADEAKKIIEKEKQKVIKEKDDALKDKMDIQKQLSILKKTLEQQKRDDEGVIRDLEAELLNQKVLIDKIKESNQSYVLKLEEELHSIQKLYQNALDKIRDSEAKLKIANDQCDQSNNIIEKAKMELEDKCKEIKSLQNIINTLQTKEAGDFATQTNFQIDMASVALQTENINVYRNVDDSWQDSDKSIKNVNRNNDSKVLTYSHNDTTRDDDLRSSEKLSDLILKMSSSKLNEKTLAKNIEPSISYIKNAYLKYKIKRLGFRQTEQYSFSVISKVISDTELLSINEKLSFDIVNDLDWPKTEISRKDSFYKMNVMSDISNMQFSNSYTNSLYSSENDRNSAFPVQTVISNKVRSDKITDSDNKYSKSSIHLNEMQKNTDNVMINEKRIMDKTKSSDEPNIIQKQNLNINDISSSKVISSEKTQPLYDEENPQQKLPYSTQYDNRNLLNYDDHFLKGSLSDTSLIKNRLLNDRKTNHKEEGNYANEINLLKSLTSNSLKSLNTSTKLNEGNDIENLKYFDSNNRIKNGDKFQHKNLLNDNTIYNILSASNPGPRVVKKSNTNGNKYKTNLGHKNITKRDNYDSNSDNIKNLTGKQRSIETFDQSNISSNTSSLYKHSRSSNIFSKKSKSFPSINGSYDYNRVKTNNVGVMAQIDNMDIYKKEIKLLNSAIENMDRDYKEKISAIKAQYDNNIRNIMNEHNQGVQSLQSLHEETLQDILKVHENETDNLRSMSIEAMRKVDKLESENKILRSKILTSNSGSFYEVPTRISSNEIKHRAAKYKAHNDIKTLTKTDVEEYNIVPKTYGPCTCSLDINISDTIRNIFEQVDVDQRKLDEQAYIKLIANKILTSSIEGLDIKELSFLHFKVCKSWKTMLRKSETLHKRIDSLESELINKQKQAQIHIAELDRKVAEERRRLQELREGVCRDSPPDSRPNISQPTKTQATTVFERTLQHDLTFTHNHVATRKFEVAETPGGDLAPGASFTELCCRRTMTGRERRIVTSKLDSDDRRDRKQCCDERPIRLRRSSDRPNARSHKK